LSQKKESTTHQLSQTKNTTLLKTVVDFVYI